MKLTLGLDIGIASVGWGIIDEENGRIIDCGVRLFDAASAECNRERRNNRQARRLIRRKKHRLLGVHTLLENNHVLRPVFNGGANPYALRVKGLTEKLTVDELYIALYHLAKRRGAFYLDDAQEKQMLASESLQTNQKVGGTLHPCQIQLERFEKYGRVRGLLNVKGEGTGNHEQLANVFPTSKYVAEAKEILQKQIELGLSVEKDFIQKYTGLLTAKRDYFIGPGNERSRSDYGIYKTDGTTLTNLFETLIGKCTIYPEEYRAASASYTAQEFNVLNGLNNLLVSGRKLTSREKQDLVRRLHTAKQIPSIAKMIAKVVGCEEAEISGLSVNKKGTEIQIPSFQVYRKLLRTFETEGFDSTVLTREAMDELGRVLTLNTEAQAIRNQMVENNHLRIFTSEMIALLIQLRKKCPTLFSGWHALSLKAMREVNPELWRTSKNQMQIFSERGVFKMRKDLLQRYNTIPIELVVDEIYNPVVRRSVRQAIQVINAVIQKYGDMDSIVIEMPREDNQKQWKRKITEVQKKNKLEKTQAILKAKESYFFTDEVFRRHKELPLKIRLWYQQNQCCIYSGQAISIRDLILTPCQFEINHIIPKSISFNDSIHNKVLCLAKESQKKGQKTPFQHLNPQAAYNTFKVRVLKLFVAGKISEAKKESLLEEADVSQWDVRQRFINRNLNDTRYASRVLLNAIQDYMLVHEKKTKVWVVRGQFTAQLRRKWDLKKEREETSAHHGIDALVVAAAKGLKLWEMGSVFEMTGSGLVDKETGEIFPIIGNEAYDTLAYEEPFKHFLSMLAEKERQMKYSYRVDRKVNRKVSDETVYSTRRYNEADYVVGKISNIYDDKSYTSFKKRYERDKTQFLMYKHDPQTFAILESVLQHYAEEKNPFQVYRMEQGEPLRKYSKKGNGPFIYALKYVDRKLGRHLDIGHKSKFSATTEKKAVMLSLKPFRTDVYYSPVTKRYELVGVKHHMFRFENGHYRLNMALYRKEKEEIEGLGKDYEFQFSLYKFDLFRWKQAGSEFEYHRFSSKNETKRNYLEVKPIERSKYEKQTFRILKKDVVVFQKIVSDVLGNWRFISKEGFKSEFQL